ncbi:hypothetical protein HYH02_002838 [Chlamydomonas schloesseri]|uniref:Uncharacterized protein n=1 Tax=Chlamydomonas schloesseri TaxID=2026947 RepID=A0A836BAE7_9CHLO|nr:hypothetical protein HYH02_002838 [Chlamydomonas schloesseri]|eukprot:KAG2452601.1 hypothetical protein HYH02_002838 [Chlamydomonas schloesseri]
MEAAAEAGHQGMCEALRRYNCPWGAALTKAAGGGHAPLCRWLLAQGAAGSAPNADAQQRPQQQQQQQQQQRKLQAAWGLWDKACMAAAAREGHLALVEELWGWAHERGLVSSSGEGKGRRPPQAKAAPTPTPPAALVSAAQPPEEPEAAGDGGGPEGGSRVPEAGDGRTGAASKNGTSFSDETASLACVRAAATAAQTAARAPGCRLAWGDLASWPMLAGAAHSVDVDTLERMLCMVHGDDGEIEDWRSQQPLQVWDHPPPYRALLMHPGLVPYDKQAAIVAAAVGSALDWDLKLEMLEARGIFHMQPGCCPGATTAAAGLWPPSLALHRLSWLLERGFGVCYLATRAATVALIKASIEEEEAAAAAAAAAAATEALRELGGRPLDSGTGAGRGRATASGAGAGRMSGCGSENAAGEKCGDEDAMAVVEDKLAVLQLLLQHQAGATDEIANIAAAAGLLEVLQLFELSLNVRLNRDALVLEAARAGQLRVVKWLTSGQDGALRRTHAVLAAAAEGGAVEVMTWLHQQGLREEPEWADVDIRAADETFPVRAAAAGGSAAALRWLVAHGYRLPEDGSPYVLAIRNGDVVTLQNLRALGCRWDPHASPQLVAAARSAQLTSGCAAVVAWLEEQGLDMATVESRTPRDARWRDVQPKREPPVEHRGEEEEAPRAARGGRLSAWWRRVTERMRGRREQGQGRCCEVILVAGAAAVEDHTEG